MESSGEEEGDDFSTLAQLGDLLDGGTKQCSWCHEFFLVSVAYPLNTVCSKECYETVCLYNSS